jgi:uncharacterized protein with HEPN domain
MLRLLADENFNGDVVQRSMAGIRDKLIHDYVSVNLEVV